MNAVVRHMILLMALSPIYRSQAQNITGSWEGIMSHEFIQINIEQRNNELCGFTYDFVLANKRSYCRAKFEGFYDNENKTWFLSGVNFMENSGGHVLMRIRLWREPGAPKNILRASVSTKNFLSSLLGVGDEFELRKVSNAPEKLPSNIAPCFPENPKPNNNITRKKPTPVKPDTSKPLPAKPASPPLVKKDTIKSTIPRPIPPVVASVDSVQLLRKMTARKQTEQSRVEINVNQINLKLYDNGIVDNDTVSVFYNGRLLVSHQKLSEKPLELNVPLDEETKIHEFTLYAENLGSIPPNTALVVVTAGTRRYELRSKASMEENAVLVFEYRKKE